MMLIIIVCLKDDKQGSTKLIQLSSDTPAPQRGYTDNLPGQKKVSMMIFIRYNLASDLKVVLVARLHVLHFAAKRLF